jgi:hypothetical protein
MLVPTWGGDLAFDKEKKSSIFDVESADFHFIIIYCFFYFFFMNDFSVYIFSYVHIYMKIIRTLCYDRLKLIYFTSEIHNFSIKSLSIHT